MHALNLIELERIAQERLPHPVFDYIAGGADDEVTLRENREAFRRITLRPRMLVGVSTVDTRTTALGEEISFPAMLAPTAFQTLAHLDGEVASARAAAAVGTITVVSTFASKRLEEVAEGGAS